MLSSPRQPDGGKMAAAMMMVEAKRSFSRAASSRALTRCISPTRPGQSAGIKAGTGTPVQARKGVSACYT